MIALMIVLIFLVWIGFCTMSDYLKNIDASLKQVVELLKNREDEQNGQAGTERNDSRGKAQ